MKKVDHKKLIDYISNNLIFFGMSKSNSDIMAKILVETDLRGTFTHGSKNLYGYIQKRIAGGVSFEDNSIIETKLPSLSIINANNTIGYIPSYNAMNMACDMAEKTGMAGVFVKNSCHFGAAGYYANIAAKRNMIGIAISNVDKKMTIPGAKGIVMGHNPFALASPAKAIESVVLDISSSNVASLKVLREKEKNKSIPEGWISDKDGLPTTDPSKYPEEGALLPMGGHKGYGIAFFIEVLTSVLLNTPLSTSNNINSWCFDLDKPNNVSHAFFAISIDAFDSLDNFKDRLELFIDSLHNSPKSLNNNRILVPGEDSNEKYLEGIKSGIEMPDDVISELEKLSKLSKIELDIYI